MPNLVTELPTAAQGSLWRLSAKAPSHLRGRLVLVVDVHPDENDLEVVMVTDDEPAEAWGHLPLPDTAIEWADAGPADIHPRAVASRFSAFIPPTYLEEPCAGHLEDALLRAVLAILRPVPRPDILAHRVTGPAPESVHKNTAEIDALGEEVHEASYQRAVAPAATLLVRVKARLAESGRELVRLLTPPLPDLAFDDTMFGPYAISTTRGVSRTIVDATRGSSAEERIPLPPYASLARGADNSSCKLEINLGGYPELRDTVDVELLDARGDILASTTLALSDGRYHEHEFPLPWDRIDPEHLWVTLSQPAEE